MENNVVVNSAVLRIVCQHYGWGPKSGKIELKDIVEHVNLYRKDKL